MAKSKTEGNISALNYLYKELNWLVNKIETSSRGKISKRDLLIYVFVGIFIVSVYFGKVIGGFTFVLVLVTLWNATITQGLLKRSKEASKQAKRALENSIFREIVSSTLQLNAILRNDWYFKKKEKRTPYIKNSVAGMLIALENIDPTMFEKISEAIKTWNKMDSRTPATIFLETLKMVEKGT